MPHLSPMSWLLMFFIIWTSLMMISSMSWWNQQPKWPQEKKQNLSLHNNRWFWS